VFERFRKEHAERLAQRTERLEAARATAKDLLEQDDIPQLATALRTLEAAWADAHEPTDGTPKLCAQLRERIDGLKRRPYEQALRPCTQCGGRDFRISHERAFERLGDLRIVVCESCGLTQIFWADLRKLDSRFSTTFRVPDHGGPFR
jgi:hypothetical protein